MSTSELIKIINNVYLPSEYSKIRERVYSLVSNYKSSRYVKVDDRVTALFEDAITVWFQIEETVYLEGTDDESVLKEAIRTYAPMIPSNDEISLTLFIYVYNYDELRNLLPKYGGIEKSVYLIINEDKIGAVPIYPEDYSPGAQPRSIHYLKFRKAGLDEEVRKATSVKLAITHGLVNKTIELSQEQVLALRNSVKRLGIKWLQA